MHKKFVLTLAFIFIFSFSAQALGTENISAKSAVVINAATREVVFEKNAHEHLSMASTTKIMTSVIAAQSGRLMETVDVTASMCGAEGTSIGLKAGYKLRLLDLVYGMMLESGNDAANAVAIFLAGSVEDFAVLMNNKAKQIGMTQSHFVTPSGLDDEQHYSTAYDMALLGAYAMEIPQLREICSSKSMKVDFINPDITVTFSNHNRLLRMYDGAIGIKTGFTKKSGRCLVSAAERNGARLVAVTLSAGDDWNDHKKMLDYSFEQLQYENIYPRIPQSICLVGSPTDSLKIEAAQYPTAVSFYKPGEMTQRVFLPAFVYAPIKRGDKVGYINFYIDDKLIKQVEIVAADDCTANSETYVPKKSFFEKMKEKIESFFGKF